MLMQAQPVFDAYKSLAGERKIRTVYLTPQGQPFCQDKAKELAKEEELIFLCGHYEGIDERVLDEIVTDYVSIGDYVLTGGELPAMVMIDAISRFIPGVLGNDTSAHEESFHNDLLEYPQYSRPEVWHGKQVPGVLLSGNHKQIVKWRLEQSEERTRRIRPDLYEKYRKKQRMIQKFLKDKRNQIHMIESLSRGLGEILYENGKDALIYDRTAEIAMMTCEDTEHMDHMISLFPKEMTYCMVNQKHVAERMMELGYENWGTCHQYVYTAKETLPVKHKEIRQLTPEDLDYICSRYVHESREYLHERLLSGAMYGVLFEDRLVGFIGCHREGSMGLLYVEEAFRGRGLAESLEAYLINRMLEKGYIPYGHIVVGNEVSEHIQEKLGLYLAGREVWWLKQKKTLA